MDINLTVHYLSKFGSEERIQPVEDILEDAARLVDATTTSTRWYSPSPRDLSIFCESLEALRSIHHNGMVDFDRSNDALVLLL